MRHPAYNFDLLGRLTSEANPESGTTSYYYDTDPGGVCAGFTGDLVKRVDQVGNATCYAYDALHRLTETHVYTGTYTSATSDKYFVYDQATSHCTESNPNTAGRLAEAYTTVNGQASSVLTDLAYCYSPRGEIIDTYQSSPNSGGYYHTFASYWPHGVVNTLGGLGLVTMATYGVGGQGRINSVTGINGQSLVGSVGYDTASQVTGVTYGSGDSDAFQFYEDSAGNDNARLQQYTLNVGSQSLTGVLTWNANGTLQNRNVTDQLNSANTQNCSFGYDDLARLASYNCGNGSGWGQTFYAGTFGNNSITATGGQATAFLPTWSPTNNQVLSINGQSWTYDANGNLTGNGTGTGSSTYSWDADGKMVTAQPYGGSEVCVTYDAFGREVETAAGNSCGSGATYTQYVYDPLGDKLGQMNGQSVSKGRVPLPGGGLGIYNASGAIVRYWRPDGMGNLALYSNPDGTFYGDTAFAPFGTAYAGGGTPSGVFGGLFGDTVSPLLDATYREFDAVQSRWLSPDPAGLAAVDDTNPQSFNRYAYVGNNPTTRIDPKGLHFFQPCLGAGACNWGDPNLGGGSSGCTIDGISGPCPTLGGNANVACPNNACTGVNSNGQPVYFKPFAGGGGGYFTYSGAGSLFYSIEEAGTAAALAAQEASAADSTTREYGGNVYADNQDGVYSYSPLQQGPPCLSTGACEVNIEPTGVPDGDSIIGLYHDHPGTGPGSYSFSDAGPGTDIPTLVSNGYYGFLATQPPGRVLMFNPNLYSSWLAGGGTPPVCVLQGPVMPETGVSACY